METFFYLPWLNKTVVTIGNFDGLHLGHQKILNIAKERAYIHNAPLVVITFWPHPSKVFGRQVPLIQRLNQRLDCLREFADTTVVLPFLRYKDLSPMVFFSLIREKLGLKEIIVGEEFRFGRGREGNAFFLREIAGEYGIKVWAIEKIMKGEVKVSSSLIRKLLLEGKIEEANLLLGKPYFVEGIKVRGEGLGRVMGFPTLNFRPLNPLVPNGIYAGILRYKREIYPAAVYCGKRPTFQNEGKILEAHLLARPPKIREGEVAEVGLLKKIRDEIKFPNLQSLREKIREDVEIIKDFFQSL